MLIPEKKEKVVRYLHFIIFRKISFRKCSRMPTNQASSPFYTALEANHFKSGTNKVCYNS